MKSTIAHRTTITNEALRFHNRAGLCIFAHECTHFHVTLNFTHQYIMERTLTILKPDCVRKQLIGAVIDQIERAGFRVVAMKKTRLTQETAGEFYAVHRERPFYGELVEFMSSGPCVPMILEKDNAVADFRTVIGATDPAEAAAGTVRKLYADSKGENIIHGSDSVENAAIEAAFFFSAEEVVRAN